MSRLCSLIKNSRVQLACALTLTLSGCNASVSAEKKVEARLGNTVTIETQVNGTKEDLKSWNLSDLRKGKDAASSQKDPDTSDLVQWKGVQLATLLDQALAKLPLEKRAEIDLVIFKGKGDAKALIPRAFITKYPILLAWNRGKQELGARGPLYSVIPWTTKPALKKEHLPVETYFVPGIHSIELANSAQRYSSVYLKRRTDPVALRGEKLFVQSCLGCHGTGRGPKIDAIATEERAKSISSEKDGHPKVSGAPTLGEKERRSLRTYLDAYRGENSATAAAGRASN